MRAEVECQAFGTILETIISKFSAFYSKMAFTRENESVVPKASLPEPMVPHCVSGWVRVMCCWSSLPSQHDNTVNFRVSKFLVNSVSLYSVQKDREKCVFGSQATT